MLAFHCFYLLVCKFLIINILKLFCGLLPYVNCHRDIFVILSLYLVVSLQKWWTGINYITELIMLITDRTLTLK